MTLAGAAINSSIQYIGEYAFANCNNLGIAKIPNAEHIGAQAYRNIGVLTGFSALPATIKYIGSKVFTGNTLAGINNNNLVWSFPANAALSETNGIVISQDVLDGCNIQ